MHRPLIGVIAAITITAGMDLGGLSAFSALPLAPLLLVLALWERFDRRRLAIVPGRLDDWLLAIAYPLFAVGAIAACAAVFGAIDTSQTDWAKAGLNFLAMVVATVIASIITEEGFFRGWLWRSLRDKGLGVVSTIFVTAAAFTAWHLSGILVPGEFHVTGVRVPILIANVALLGIAWGLLRAVSCSVVVTSVAHGMWNGLVYTLFGIGEKAGALGIRDSYLFGPESGVAGLGVNAATIWLFWILLRRRRKEQSQAS